MRNLSVMLCAGLVVAGVAWPAEQELESRVASIGMFKNGLAVVTRTVDVPGPGVYLVTNPPEPVHGSFWLESDATVEARMTTRELEIPVAEAGGPGLEEEWAGATVTLYFRDAGIPPATGTVLETGKAAPAWNRNYQPPQYGFSPFSSWRYPDVPNPAGQSAAARYLVLRTDRGRVYADASMIAYADVAGARDTLRQTRPVLELTVTEGPAPARVTMSYLTKGIAWAPSYRLDLSGDTQLTIEQAAVIKNELEDTAEAEMYLISGFPSVQFAHVTSPFSLNTTWTAFFQQLSQQIRPYSGLGHAATQQAVVSNVISPVQGIDFSAIPLGEGPDIHYQPIGRRSLKAGDALAVQVASASASCERIVEWIVPDTRGANGQYLPEHRYQEDPDALRDTAWDAVRFKNPLPFPMTTGAAMILSDGRFLGQQMCYWTNKGESAIVHITQALSIRTRSTEYEMEGTREQVYIAGQRYQKTTVKGELTVSNHREETVKLLIRRRFSGDLLRADGDPACVLLEEGVWCVNKRNELTWTVDLQPGQETALAYEYVVLVYF